MFLLIRYLSVQCKAISIHPSSDSIVITRTFHFLYFFFVVENVRLVCGLCTRCLPVNGTTGVNKHYFTLYADFTFRFCTFVLLQEAFPV